MKWKKNMTRNEKKRYWLDVATYMPVEITAFDNELYQGYLVRDNITRKVTKKKKYQHVEWMLLPFSYRDNRIVFALSHIKHIRYLTNGIRLF